MNELRNVMTMKFEIKSQRSENEKKLSKKEQIKKPERT